MQIEEPITHRKNKTISEAIFGKCTDKDFTLTKQEILEWRNLRDEVRPLYDTDDPNCLKRLKGLWYILTETDLPNDEPRNEMWKEFGFQQANPITDFRGGGIQSLDDLAYYAQTNKDTVIQMCDPANDYYFAASSINVTFFMKKYFHLLDHLDPTKDKKEYCGRLAFKNFCHLLVVEDNLWQQLHSLLLTDLYVNCWMGLRKERPNVTIMDYGIAFDRMRRKCKIALSTRFFQNFAQLKLFYSQI